MSEPTRIPRSSETIQTPRPSWGPAFFALGATGAVAGIYANGFVFSAFIWSYIGIVILLIMHLVPGTAGTNRFGGDPTKP